MENGMSKKPKNPKKWSAHLKRLRLRALAAITAHSEPKKLRTRGVVSSVVTDDSGRITSARVNLRSGPSVQVSGSSIFGLAVGAEVELESQASASPRFNISRIVRHGIGAGSSDSMGFLSTPDFILPDGNVPTEVNVGIGGDVTITAQFVIAQIKEQWQHRQAIQYVVEVREATNAEISFSATSTVNELICGELVGAINETSNSLTVGPISIEPSPSSYFPDRYILCLIDTELIFCRSAFQNLTRGYAGTTASDHATGSAIVCRSTNIAISKLKPHVAYEARIYAQSPVDGRRSNSSEWQPFITEFDVTPPSWSAPFTPTAISTTNAILIEWPAADQDFYDLARYTVELIQNEEPSRLINAGTGSSLAWQAPSGAVLRFRVRAEDTTGNVSDWSDWGRGVAIDYGPAGDEFLENNSFEIWPNGWSTETVSSFDFTNASEEGLYGDFSREFTMKPIYLPANGYNSPLMQGQILSAQYNCAQGDTFYCSIWLNIRKYYQMEQIGAANMFFWLSAEFENSNTGDKKYQTLYYGNGKGEAAIIRRVWIQLQINATVPSGYDRIRLIIYIQSNFYDATLDPEILKVIFRLDGAALRRISAIGSPI